MGLARAAQLLCAVLAICGTTRLGQARTLQQSSACITSTTTVDSTQGLASDPYCLKVGDFSVLCPRSPNQPCACPTLSYVNTTSDRNNLLGCYDPTLYFCSTVSPQFPQTPDNYGRTALIQGSGESNIGVCWNQTSQSLSDWGTANNALLPSAAAVANASAEANLAAAPPVAAPPPAPASDASDSNAGKITGIIFGVAGPTFATILWLSITLGYRQEKAIVVRGVMRHVATADITSNSIAFIGTGHNEAQKQKAKDSLTLPLDRHSEPQAGLYPAGPGGIPGQSTTRPVFGRSPNIERPSLASSIGRSSSIGLLGQLHSTASVDSKTTAEEDLFLMEVRKVAKEITERCLRRWDSFLAVRAAMDSLGNSAGVWKRKFESVRSAVMLLAFRNVNAMMQMQVLRAEPGTPDPPGSLMAAWQVGDSHERSDIVTLITQALQDITAEEAQALRKDAEPRGMHDRLVSVLERSTGRMSSRSQNPQPSVYRERPSSGSSAATHIQIF